MLPIRVDAAVADGWRVVADEGVGGGDHGAAYFVESKVI